MAGDSTPREPRAGAAAPPVVQVECDEDMAAASPPTHRKDHEASARAVDSPGSTDALQAAGAKASRQQAAAAAAKQRREQRRTALKARSAPPAELGASEATLYSPAASPLGQPTPRPEPEASGATPSAESEGHEDLQRALSEARQQLAHFSRMADWAWHENSKRLRAQLKQQLAEQAEEIATLRARAEKAEASEGRLHIELQTLQLQADASHHETRAGDLKAAIHEADNKLKSTGELQRNLTLVQERMRALESSEQKLKSELQMADERAANLQAQISASPPKSTITQEHTEESMDSSDDDSEDFGSTMGDDHPQFATPIVPQLQTIAEDDYTNPEWALYHMEAASPEQLEKFMQANQVKPRLDAVGQAAMAGLRWAKKVQAKPQ